MRLEGYKPAKNLVLLEEVVTEKKGSIHFVGDKTAGYFKVIKVGPLVEIAKPGDYILSTLQMGVQIELSGKNYMQLPEVGIDGYYSPTKEELEAPIPLLKIAEDSDDEELNVIDSEGGDNNFGSEPELRE